MTSAMHPGHPVAGIGVGTPVLAFDVGGTDTKSALITDAGELVGVQRTPTPLDPDHPVEAVVEHLALLAARYRTAHPAVSPASAGVSVPGIVAEDSGIAVFASNLGFRDAPVRELASTALGMPVAFGHDVRAAGDAEHRLGAAQGFRDAVVFVIGTGIAAALIVNGHPYAAGGYAGELGHALSDPDGEVCACGARGCLETIASAGAITRRYRARTGASAEEVPGSKVVLARARAGDALASEVWEDAVRALATSIARLAATVAPEAVVIGGGLSRAGDALFVPLREQVDALLSFHRRPQLLPAALGDDAGLLGTALAARDLLGR